MSRSSEPVSQLIASHTVTRRVEAFLHRRQGDFHVRLSGLCTDSVHAVMGQQQMGHRPHRWRCRWIASLLSTWSSPSPKSPRSSLNRTSIAQRFSYIDTIARAGSFVSLVANATMVVHDERGRFEKTRRTSPVRVQRPSTAAMRIFAQPRARGMRTPRRRYFSNPGPRSPILCDTPHVRTSVRFFEATENHVKPLVSHTAS